MKKRKEGKVRLLECFEYEVLEKRRKGKLGDMRRLRSEGGRED